MIIRTFVFRILYNARMFVLFLVNYGSNPMKYIHTFRKCYIFCLILHESELYFWSKRDFLNCLSCLDVYTFFHLAYLLLSLTYNQWLWALWLKNLVTPWYPTKKWSLLPKWNMVLCTLWHHSLNSAYTLTLTYLHLTGWGVHLPWRDMWEI